MPRSAYRPRGKPLTIEWIKSQCKVDKSTGCWLWQRNIQNSGYGGITVNGRLSHAHRVVFSILHGDPGPGIQVCHSCDVRHCCNPKHLWKGTNAENMADRNLKNRQARLKGESNGFSILTEPQVRFILVSTFSGNRLAKKFNTSASNISMIRRRKTWKHIII